MKKNTLHTILSLIVVIAFVIGVRLITHAATGVWSNPSSTAPGNNLDAPVHVNASQVKQIGTGTSNAGGLSVNAFISGGTAYFDQQTFFPGTVYGGTPTVASGVTIGGPANSVDVVNTGNVSAASFIQSQSVANTSSKALCANASGVIIICP